MLLSRWFSLGPVALLAWSCTTADDTQGTGGAAGTPGGSGNPTGGVSGTGNPTGGASGVTGTGGSGATPTGGIGGSGMGTGGSGAGGSATGGSTMGGSSTGGAAGSTSTGGAGPTGGTGGSTTCTITPTSSVSTRIPTVGIVTFTTDLAGMTEAHIDFGRDMNYGMTAPVDLAAMSYRTLLLGMKPSTMYNYRIVATGPSGTCTGGNNTIMTGARATGLPTITRNPMTATGLYGGFLITGQYQGSTGSGAPAYILDADGEYVWWYMTGQNNVTGVRMSYDGKYMWINAANVPESQGATVYRVSMDGMMQENLSSQFTGQNHQMTVLPDETVAFYAYSSNGCDDIKERNAACMVKTVANSRTAQGLTSGACHVNGIEYSPEDDTLVFSDLDHDSITKVRRSDGTPVWVLGGTTSDFTMATWDRQHGIDVLGLDRLLFFNNGPMGGGSGSVAIEILLNISGGSSTRPWTYTAMPSIANQIMGDVQRMENGNTIVAYSTQGVLHEVNAAGQLLQELEWPSGAAYGYIQKRKTLYGPPPR
jgi:hypothetical protein